MDSYSLPTASSFAKYGIPRQSSPPSKPPNTSQPLQTGRKRSQEESVVSASNNSSSLSEKHREGQIMEDKTRASKLEKAPQQPESKLLPLSYRNDPMRVASSYRREYVSPEISNRNYKKITSKASRLGNIDLEAFLKDDRVWNKLTSNQQQRLIERSGLEFVTDIKQLPNGKWPNLWNLAQEKEHIVLEEAVEKYQRNLRAGKLDPEWRASAKSAAVKRTRGDFMRQDTLTEEEDEDGEECSGEESSEESEVENDQWLDKFEDDVDVEMVDAGPDGETAVKKIPKRLLIKIHED
ncbi:hypothetical protein EG328_004261 [Venturia inaequalis]|uniref:ASX DEUBAD domain-containing protein n=1 Tax=Venturia inaequalis TaxID=5025 RepID=A0A8H3VGT7_VENIN|nr:hypothetical protein EG328_004261 [Venturia inaequalis]KAE9989867.1 hypothetical protein EG327_002169 [Venturia inaequalis]